MWKVYANRVFGLRFFSLLCRTDPWIRTKSPRKSQKEGSDDAPQTYVDLTTWLTTLEHILAGRRGCLS
jgi:hypothetical protein